MSKRSRCDAVRICFDRGEPSAEVVRVEALSLWRRSFILAARIVFERSRGLRAAFAIAASRVSIPPWSAPAPAQE